ncbi:hypothetical protein PVNG_02343 [Plasmodium vivax North Korean]|uniref:ComEC/Rec2-related protein domain-containing protein n=1 Tax=Plasmodium vivax North Korean TaxID=1035514 RepID=A0A0J9TKF4_PLAVI|nr:hypothetical protein PVNG_02343 [Plasmodium vivax North Korean]
MVSSRYPGESGKFISFLLFNRKSSGLKDMFGEFTSLSITHLLVVSGAHMTVLRRIVEFLVKIIPFEKVRRLIVLSFLFMYT